MDVSVSVGELLKTLRENRDIHKAEVELMFQKYHEKLKELLAKTLEDLNNGVTLSKAFDTKQLIYPVDHTEDYDKTIRRLEHHTEANITLDEYEYERYMDDIWSFTQQHLGATRGGYGIDLKHGRK